MWKKVLVVLGILAVLGCAVLFYFRNALFTNNINDSSNSYEIYIPTGSNFNAVLDTLVAHDVLENVQTFQMVSKLMKYQKESVPSGRYIVKSGMSNRELVGKLRAGLQDPVNVVFNNLRTIEELSGQIATNLEADSTEILEAITDPAFMNKYEKNSDDLLTLFIPNTYQMYWNEQPKDVAERLAKEHQKFWNNKNRQILLDSLGMTKAEVYTLASIVEKESNLQSERPTVAGVYLNRIRQGIPLQADPTVVFATGLFDLRRVLNKHLEIDSPYNTYKNLGLPPGPIYMPSINSIDAVLANEQHEYIFFCAKPGYNSGHLFAKTNAQHEANARTYRRWLTSQNIR